jgi:hypothetical protein
VRFYLYLDILQVDIKQSTFLKKLFLFQVCILIHQFNGTFDETADLVTLRMASFNQILDPWVYLLFRRESLRKFVRNFQ